MDKMLSTMRNPVRRRVVLLLAFLSSKKCQRACVRFISPEKLAFELCRLWCDEIYAPGMRYVTDFKADRSEDDAAQFWANFSQEERESLERFHRFLELRVDMLPEEARRRREFPQSDLWESITRDASHTLADLAADADALQKQLFWIVCRLSTDDFRLSIGS